MPRYTQPFTTYAEVAAYFKQHARYPREVKGREGKKVLSWSERTDLPKFCKLQTNTTLREIEGRGWVLGPLYAVVLHHTNILVFEETLDHGGMVTVSTGGWLTQTTRDRINTYLSDECLHLWQERGVVTMHQRRESYAYPGHHLGPFIEGFQVYLDGTLPSHSVGAQERMVVSMQHNALLERGINRLVRKAIGHSGRMLAWEQDIDSRGSLICEPCILQQWSREHLEYHVLTGKLTTELVEQACKKVQTAARYNWRGSGGDARSAAARLRAYLRDWLLIGPYVTKSGRRLPEGGVTRARGFNHHPVLR